MAKLMTRINSADRILQGRRQRPLVYERMSNGTLADYLFAKLVSKDHNHSRRCNGAAVFARGYFGFWVGKTIGNKPESNEHCNQTDHRACCPVMVQGQDSYSEGGYLELSGSIICCHKSICVDINMEEVTILTEWAFDSYQSRTLASLVNDHMEALTDRPRL
ncbi:hypothetical protein Cgig2_000468 [Carnegiea gigantea]|uniref:Uncharacterized protein n=1 Tax=Carnegiea gigantea TaxID=171969 RepID=A0A9Q1QBU0_9CARY|nr:hypothetical protein Cgig2_000468 [Carnegiea gigantea]